jgi:replicative DNA helicase
MTPAEEHSMSMLDLALDYAARGFAVFPADPSPMDRRGKAPLTTNGMKDASTDLAQVREWWTIHPDALIACRIPQDVVVLDVDPRHGGLDTWQRLEETFGAIPVACKHRSGRDDGGFHAWFMHPGGKLSAKALHEWARGHGVGHATGKRGWSSGIDILHHDHRYTILPGSLHPETRKPYTWVAEATPGKMPGFVAALVIAAPVTPAAKPVRLVVDDDSIADWFTAHHTWQEILGPAGWVLVDGSGDDDGSRWRHSQATAAWSASIKNGCLFVYTDNTDFDSTADGDPKGYTRFRAWATLEHDGDLKAAARDARERRDGPYVARNDHTITVGATPAAPDDEWTQPVPLATTFDAPGFPLETLPKVIADHVRQVARELQVSPDLPAQLALAALSIVIAGRVRVQIIANGWTEPVNLYIVIALPPGAGKSPSVNKMLAPIEAYEARIRPAVEGQREHVEQTRRMVEKQLRKAEDKNDKLEASVLLDEYQSLKLPVVPRLIADDATPEALTQLLHDQGGRLALVSTEGGPFEIMAGRYSERSNLDVYLKSFSGDGIRVDRIGRPSITINQPALTVALTVQPSVIASLAANGEFTGKGLTARFMYAVPVDFVGQRDYLASYACDPATTAAYGALFDWLLDRFHGPGDVQVLQFSPDATRRFREWQQALEHRRSPLGDLRPMAEWTTKCESSTARVAGLLAAAEGAPEVDLGIVDRAIAIGEYWLAHAHIVHDLWEADVDMGNAKAILAYVIERHLEEFTPRDIYANLRKRFPRAEDVHAPLTILTEREWIRPLFDGPLKFGARGREQRFAVHPDASLWITASHARHARHVPKDEKEVHSLSLKKDSRERHPVHDAHDAHDAIGADLEELQPAAQTSTTQSGEVPEIDPYW